VIPLEVDDLPREYCFIASGVTGPAFAHWTPEMEHRAKEYQARYAEVIQRRWGIHFNFEIWNDMLRLNFPVESDPDFRTAVRTWIAEGEGIMPDPAQK